MSKQHERISGIIPGLTPDIGHKVTDEDGHSGWGETRSEAEKALRVAQEHDVQWAEWDKRPIVGDLLPGYVLGPRIDRETAQREVEAAHVRRANERNRARSEYDTRTPTDSGSSSTDNGSEFLGKLIGGAIAIIAAIWFLFAVMIPLVVINAALIALGLGVAANGRRRHFLLGVSLVGAGFVVADYNIGWLTAGLVESFQFFRKLLPTFLYVNVAAGLAAAFVLARAYLDARHPITDGQARNRRAAGLAAGLMVVGLAFVVIQVNVDDQSPKEGPMGSLESTGGGIASQETKPVVATEAPGNGVESNVLNSALSDSTIEGTLFSFDCGDSCYLTITDVAGSERTALCVATLCDEWEALQAMPATYKGRQVRVSLGTGTQYDGAGNAVGTTESFTHLRLSGLEVASERSPTSVGLAPNAITELPIGTNLREVQRRRSDNTLIVHYSGALELMGSALPLDTVHSGIVSELRARFREQSCDRILFLRADRRTPFRTIAALDVPLAAGGVDILGLEADQTTGTVSLVEGDRTGVAAADMHRIVPIYLRGPRPASQHANTEAAPIVLEVAADGAVRLNREPVPFSALFERMREIVALRPDRVVFVSAPSAPYEAVLRAIDQTRGAGIVILRLWPQGRTVPQGLPDIDLSRRVIAEGDFRRC